MRRATLALSGMIGLVALAGTGCCDWKTVLDDLRDAKRPPADTGGAPAGTGAGGSAGGGVAAKCGEGSDASGRICKTCWDETGKVVSSDCAPGTGTGGSGGGSDPGQCIKLSDGGPTSCKDLGTWKKYGTDACAQKNLSLVELAPATTCDGGNYESVIYVCCPGSTGGGGGPVLKCGESSDASGRICKTCWDETGKVVSSDCASGTGGSSGSDGQACTTIDDGGPTSCKDAATWKQYGADACAQRKLSLVDVKVATTCAGGNAERVTYVCCPDAPPTGGGAVLKCDQTAGANGQVCKTCWDETGKVVSNYCPTDSAPKPTGE